MRYKILLIIILLANTVQAMPVRGYVYDVQTNEPIAYANVFVVDNGTGVQTDEKGSFAIDCSNSCNVVISFIGYQIDTVVFNIDKTKHSIGLTPIGGRMEEVVVTGTMKEVSRMNSPIPVEVFTPEFFKKNPTPSLFDALSIVNGVQPQLNCNVCNTGDIHINGMEGPYTMILIDGMPIVSGLATVYGLSGIPNSIVERIEVVKGPASSLYGSEAMGGVVNVITKKPDNAPIFSVDLMSTSWQEYNADISGKLQLGKLSNLTGVNYYNYNQRIDNNDDGFTDLTLQNRISVFNKMSLERRDNKLFSVAARYVYEDRWGGETNWSRQWRGTDSIYGESIYTSRWELISMYQLPIREKVMMQLSYNNHDQNSYYGDVPYFAQQKVAFTQLYWDKKIGSRHNLLLGASYRYTYYDDNTPGTASGDSLNISNKPSETPLPGAYIQDEWSVSKKSTVLLGYRYDYDKYHGHIQSPRLAYKLSPDRNNTFRASFGTGYRVVNLFTEDHAALTGARDVIITEELDPERSYNGNLNYVLKVPGDEIYTSVDATFFYSYFTNKIVGDFDTDPDKIIYDNLRGNAVSQGVSVNTSFSFSVPLRISLGFTYMDVYIKEENEMGELEKTQQLFAPKWSGNIVAGYTFPKQRLTIDFTGKWNGPMRLPILINDYRPEYSPWYIIANLQLSKKFSNIFEVYGGVKNLFDFVPKDPIIRPFDPFDKNVNDPVNNPNGYTFDPTYNYASLQGIRGFLGVRFTVE